MNTLIVGRDLRSNLVFLALFLAVFVIAAQFPLIAFPFDRGEQASNPYTTLNLVTLFYATILSMILGSLLVNREEERRTIEVLLAFPVSRRELMASKLAVLCICCLIAGGVMTASLSVLVVTFRFNGGSVSPILALGAMQTLYMIFAGTAAALLALLVRHTRTLIGIAITSACLLSFLRMLDLPDGASWLLRLNPMCLVDETSILSGLRFARNAALLFFLSVILQAGLIVVYERRDIAT